MRCNESRRRGGSEPPNFATWLRPNCCLLDLLVNPLWDSSRPLLRQRHLSSSVPTPCCPPRSTSPSSTSSEARSSVYSCSEPANNLQYTGKRVVLASASPRRSEILETFGLKPEIVPSTFPETLSHGDFDDAGQYCVATGTAKVSCSSLKSLRPKLIAARSAGRRGVREAGAGIARRSARSSHWR